MKKKTKEEIIKHMNCFKDLIQCLKWVSEGNRYGVRKKEDGSVKVYKLPPYKPKPVDQMAKSHRMFFRDNSKNEVLTNCKKCMDNTGWVHFTKSHCYECLKCWKADRESK